LICTSPELVPFSRESNDKDSVASSRENPGVKIIVNESDSDMFDSVVRGPEMFEPVLFAYFERVNVSMSDSDMFDSVVRESEMFDIEDNSGIII